MVQTGPYSSCKEHVFFLLMHPHGNSQKYPSITRTCQQAPLQPRMFAIAVISQASGGTVNSGSLKYISFYYKTHFKVIRKISHL